MTKTTSVRAQWDDYQQAYGQLLATTHTPWAPWTIVPSDPRRIAT
ncbi:hypothetical protein J4714_12970 [Staphylococcus epidermidis]|nr:hypothetical protein [Staphylococcus epidermidis]